MIIKCKMCGGDLTFTEGSTVCECEYCGSRQTVPTADNEKKANLFNRANRLRMSSEFDKASAVYEQIVAEFPEEAEAYWGLCLCAYGIEYVDDPATGSKIPTCHRTLPTSIMEDSNFKQACDNSDVVARKVYREEAKAIDRIQKNILSIVANEQPYDVFICYKETAEDGSRTEDSVLAQDIYDVLTAKGMKVFFSRITLEDKLGVQYEPYIYAALASAKVMLAIGTRFEYYDAVWVKNEWSRFLGMMKSDRSKMLIPCFKGLDAYDMPNEFKGLQAQDMGKLGWMQDLTRGILKIISPEQLLVPQIVQAQATSSVNTENLLKRVKAFLRDKEWNKAGEYIERILDEDAECSEAYFYKVLLKLECSTVEELKGYPLILGGCSDFTDAYETGSTQQKAELNEIKNACMRLVQLSRLTGVLQEIEKEKESQEQLASLHEARYQEADSLSTSPGRACVVFWSIASYRDSAARAEQYACQYNDDRKKAEKAKLQAEHDANVDMLTMQITNKEQELAKAKALVITANTKIAEKTVAIDTIKERLSSLEKDFSQIRGLFSSGKKKAIQEQINTEKSELHHAEWELNSIKMEQEAAEKKTEQLPADVDVLKKSLSALETADYSASDSYQPLTIEQIVKEFPADWKPISNKSTNQTIMLHCKMCGFRYKAEYKGTPCPLCGEIL